MWRNLPAAHCAARLKQAGRICLSVLAAFFLMASPASGNESRYSDSFSDTCREIDEYELGITVRCEAFGHYYDVAEQGNRASEAFDECAQEVVAPTCLLELPAV